VVRQTLYEARRNLEQMDSGRGMRCEAVTRVLSDADGRVSGRRQIRAHLRDCPGCRRFQGRIEARKETFAGVALPPAALAGGLLQSTLAGTGGSGAGVVTAAVSGSAAKSAGTAVAMKAVAAVAAVAVIGTVAVDRNSREHRATRDDTGAPLSRQGHVAHSPSPPERGLPRLASPSSHGGPAVAARIEASPASASPEAAPPRRAMAPGHRAAGPQRRRTRPRSPRSSRGPRRTPRSVKKSSRGGKSTLPRRKRRPRKRPQGRKQRASPNTGRTPRIPPTRKSRSSLPRSPKRARKKTRRPRCQRQKARPNPSLKAPKGKPKAMKSKPPAEPPSSGLTNPSGPRFTRELVRNSVANHRPGAGLERRREDN